MEGRLGRKLGQLPLIKTQSSQGAEVAGWQTFCQKNAYSPALSRFKTFHGPTGLWSRLHPSATSFPGFSLPVFSAFWSPDCPSPRAQLTPCLILPTLTHLCLLAPGAPWPQSTRILPCFQSPGHPPSLTSLPKSPLLTSLPPWMLRGCGLNICCDLSYSEAARHISASFQDSRCLETRPIVFAQSLESVSI